MDKETLKTICAALQGKEKQYRSNRAYVRGKNPTIANNATGDDPDNRLAIPLGKLAVDSMVGYMMPPGSPDVYYELLDSTDKWDKRDDEYNQIIKDWSDYNDDTLHIGEMVSEAMSQGTAYEVWWTSEDTTPGFPIKPEWVMVPASQIYIKWSNTLKPVKEYAVRMFADGENTHAVVYFTGNAEGWIKEKNKDWARYEDNDLSYPFEEVPVLEAKINKDGECLFEAEKQIIDQIDKIMSKSLNEVDRFNAMIALFPFIITPEIAAELKTKGYFHDLDPYDSDKWPRYLEKNLSGAVEFYKWMLENLERYFHKTSRIIDFTDPQFGAGGEESGKALAIKLMCMEMVAGKAEIYLRRWLTERKGFFDACIYAGTSDLDPELYKVEIKWSRNVPVSEKERLEIASMMMGLGMTKEAILKILPKTILPDWERELEDQDTMQAPTAAAVDVEEDGTAEDVEGATIEAEPKDIQKAALNGAQVDSLLTIATNVAQGVLPSDSARAIASSAFPAIDQSDLDKIFNPLEKFTPRTEDVGKE
jgi:SPP1 family phage portal protein